MRLLRAHEDFAERTLAGLPTILGKLRFLSSIRISADEYQHWGLERTYGKESAQEAVRTAHTEIFLTELSTPLSELWKELSSEANHEGTELSYLAKILFELVRQVPTELGGGSERHHDYVLRALFLLAQTRDFAKQVA